MIGMYIYMYLCKEQADIVVQYRECIVSSVILQD